MHSLTVLMVNQRITTALLNLFIIILGVRYNYAQDNSITFIPDVPLCIGEEVQMICFVVPPVNTSFVVDTALISFNGSQPALLDTFNSTHMLGGVNTSRYTADTTGLSISTSRPGVRITISDYQATDESVVFGCAGVFPNGSYSDVLISGSPQALAVPPSPPVSLTADYNSPTCSGTVQLAWTPGASDRDIEMYFLSLNGVMIASLDPSERTFNYPTTLRRNKEYTYSVVAMSCAGNSMETTATSISVGNPPSSPLVTLSQTDTICSNALMWSTPSSDKSITWYSISRDGVSIRNIHHTITEYTDSYRIDINTVYEYSVVAFSCAGTSTSFDVNSTRIEGTSLNISSPLSISYDNTTYVLFVDWTLNQPTQPINVTYNLSLEYSCTQFNVTYSYEKTHIFSQISNDTNYIQYLPLGECYYDDGLVVLNITANLSITKQCNTPLSEGIVLTATTESAFTFTDTSISFRGVLIFLVVVCATAAGVSCLCYCCVLILVGVLILVIDCCDSKKKDSKKKSNTQEQGPVEEKMEVLYADIDHTFPKPDTLKEPEPVEEILYAKVQPSVDGPSL